MIRIGEAVSEPLRIELRIEQWPLAAPFRITGYTFEVLDILLVTLHGGGHTGRAEAVGVYYRGDRAATMMSQIEALRPMIERGVTRSDLFQLLAPGGARNALDCALWNLNAKCSGRPAWQLAELQHPQPLLTTFTCPADEPKRMAATARTYSGARAIKLKLTGEGADADRIRFVRDALPDVWLGVDANQGFTRAAFEKLMPVLLDERIALIEQPFPVGAEHLLDGLQSPIPIAADESVQSLRDLPALVGRFNVINIKLDKCGGLTEALAMARAARGLGLDTMVGNMMGTSLAMAPAFLVGQLCSVADLDGPTLLKADRSTRVHYCDGYITCPESLWD